LCLEPNQSSEPIPIIDNRWERSRIFKLHLIECPMTFPKLARTAGRYKICQIVGAATPEWKDVIN
ncbi:hypothetical protein MQC88_00475, partial [Luteimonas sp. 50]